MKSEALKLTIFGMEIKVDNELKKNEWVLEYD